MSFLYTHQSHTYQKHAIDFFTAHYCINSKPRRAISDFEIRISDLVEELKQERDLRDLEDYDIFQNLIDHNT